MSGSLYIVHHLGVLERAHQILENDAHGVPFRDEPVHLA